MVRIRLKYMLLEVIKREIIGVQPNVVSEVETLAQYEVMDGVPIRGTFSSYPSLIAFRRVDSRKIATWVDSLSYSFLRKRTRACFCEILSQLSVSR
jgi:hypothetical protein